MKKITIGFVLLSLFALSACSGLDVFIETKEPEKTPGTEGGFVKSNLERETSPQIGQEEIQSLAEANAAFALSFYDHIRQQSANIIFSPLSLSLALSMTMAGAETTTEEAMLEALRLSMSEEDVHQAFNALLLAIQESQETEIEDTEGTNFQLNIANSIWGQSGFDFKDSFLDTLALNYGVGLYSVNFVEDPEAGREAINDWVEEETEEKIQDLIPQGAITPLTRLVLANAIYFNGSWLHPFDEADTQEAPFFTLDGTEIPVDMMRLPGERLLYTQGGNYQAVSLPYLSPDFDMALLVPDSGVFEDYEAGLDAQSLTAIFTEMSSVQLNLQMPKFDFDSTINANEPLKAMGMGEAFDPDQSDFTGIADVDDLHITDVLHKATITVDEEGTEAAAATAVIVGVTSAPPEEPITLVVDRPFLFLIRHKPTNSILFMGRVIQP